MLVLMRANRLELPMPCALCGCQVPERAWADHWQGKRHRRKLQQRGSETDDDLSANDAFSLTDGGERAQRRLQTEEKILQRAIEASLEELRIQEQQESIQTTYAEYLSLKEQ